MELIFNKILSATWILYCTGLEDIPHTLTFKTSNHFFLFGYELNLDGFCPGFVFLSGIKKVDV